MPALLLLAFLAIAAVDVWASIAVMFKPGWLGASFWIAAVLALVAAIGMTGFFSYYSNPNTHVFGWPIPRLIFQRDTPTSPWLDFIGPTIVLAYPMNFILYMFIPSVVFILVSRRRKHETRNEV